MAGPGYRGDPTLPSAARRSAPGEAEDALGDDVGAEPRPSRRRSAGRETARYRSTTSPGPPDASAALGPGPAQDGLGRPGLVPRHRDLQRAGTLLLAAVPTTRRSSERSRRAARALAFGHQQAEGAHGVGCRRSAPAGPAGPRAGRYRGRACRPICTALVGQGGPGQAPAGVLRPTRQSSGTNTPSKNTSLKSALRSPGAERPHLQATARRMSTRK